MRLCIVGVHGLCSKVHIHAQYTVCDAGMRCKLCKRRSGLMDTSAGWTRNAPPPASVPRHWCRLPTRIQRCIDCSLTQRKLLGANICKNHGRSRVCMHPPAVQSPLVLYVWTSPSVAEGSAVLLQLHRLSSFTSQPSTTSIQCRQRIARPWIGTRAVVTTLCIAYRHLQRALWPAFPYLARLTV